MHAPRPSAPQPIELHFLRLPDLLRRRGTSRSATYRHIAEGTLPPPVKLGPNTSAWPEHEITAIDAARIAGSTEDEIRALVKSLVAARKVAA
jgi:prophage regulatory protein